MNAELLIKRTPFAPRSASSSAIEAPMPLEPRVTITYLFSKTVEILPSIKFLNLCIMLAIIYSLMIDREKMFWASFMYHNA